MPKLKTEETQTFQVGDLTYVTPPIPQKNLILGSKLQKKDQKWKRIEFPADFDSKTEEEKIDLIKIDLNRRLNGVWFMNNGKPTYLSGDHYFYLNHWWMGAPTDDGYPHFKISDLLEFYFWDYCEKDINCYGEIFLSGRRRGKTERALCRIYNKTSIFEQKKSGLQAQTIKKAEDDLFKKIVRSWKRLPSEIKPIDEGISDPKRGLRFIEPSKKSTKGKAHVYKKAINSIIDYRATTSYAYQGNELFRMLLDEPASIEEMDFFEWFSTTKKCFEYGSTIRGKMFLPATVENMKLKGGQAYMALWDQSDFSRKNSNGRTQSGLYRYFEPAYMGYAGFIDEYGYDILTPEGEPEAKIFLQNERDGATDEEKIKLKRQFPFTVEEAFDVSVSDVWESDVKEILKHVRQSLLEKPAPLLNCTLYEVNGKVEKADCPDNKEGVVRIYELPKEGVKYVGGFDGAGSDKQTGDESGSKVALVILKSFEGVDKENFIPVLTYSLRPERMAEAYQTVYLASKLFNEFGNFKLLGEANAGQAPAVVAYFGNRGAEKLLMKKPKNPGMKYNETQDKYWIYRNEPVKEMQKFLANNFIRKYGSGIRFLKLIADLVDMGKRNTDEADAFLMAVLGMGDFDKAIDQKRAILKKPRMVRVFKTGPDGSVSVEWVTAPSQIVNPRLMR